jgi:hypothetical protein
VRLHPSAQHTWTQLSACLSSIIFLSASPVAPVRLVGTELMIKLSRVDTKLSFPQKNGGP